MKRVNLFTSQNASSSFLNTKTKITDFKNCSSKSFFKNTTQNCSYYMNFVERQKREKKDNRYNLKKKQYFHSSVNPYI